MSISDYFENVLLGNTALDSPYVKLHTADPGEAGTTAPAANTTRKQITLAAASSGTRTSSTDGDWTNVPNAETYSHVSLWDASSGGNCLWSGALGTPKTVAVGDEFKIASGSLSVSLD